MPHVVISHYPADLSETARRDLAEDVTAAIRKAFGSRDGAISIALRPVEKDRWMVDVYEPEIERHRDRLIKHPDY